MIDKPTIEKWIALVAAMKQGLLERGDVEAAEHSLEHHLLAGSVETAAEFRALADRLGFSSTEPMQAVLDVAPNDLWYAFDIISRRDTKMPAMLHECLMVMMLTNSYAMLYNGSGVLAVPASHAAT